MPRRCGSRPELRARVLAGGEAPRAQHRPRRRRAAGLVIAAACVLTAVLLFGDRADGPDLSARAYAATTGPGIVHWRTEIAGSSGRHRSARASAPRAGPATGSPTSCATTSSTARRSCRATHAPPPAARTTWIRAEHDYLRFPARRVSGTDPFSFGDPFAIYRRAYRAGKLTKVGPTPVRIDLPGSSDDDQRGAP